jgi:hypothetical protein
MAQHVLSIGMSHSTMVTLDEYIPVYRTPAGTGCGLGFACWS